ncbi:replicative DNA helicase [Chelonobacter oris]|uniref:replicative DNA helicase n=1 Tax=Chelonobacter oris TaxID=505317 RepID=UPI002A2B17FB|nr:replicative DNA helicase [Chelonobacter oris]
MMNVQNKLYSTDAECAVLGGLLLNNDSFDDVVAIINPSDFYLTAHQYIFKGISALIETGKPADILTVEQYFKEQGILQELGGMSYLAEIAKNTPSVANISTYADIVLLHSKYRQLLQLGQFITHEVQSTGTEEKFEELIENVEQKLTAFSLAEEKAEAADLNSTFNRMLTRMELCAQDDNPVSGVPTGIRELDEVTTGGQAGDFIVIGARPSMGKTAFLQTVARNTLEAFPKVPIQFYSMEMSADQILQRFLAMQSRVELQHIRKANNLSDEDWAKIATATTYILENWKNRLLIDDECGLTPQKLRSKVRLNTRKYGKPSAIFIDYLQLMRTAKRYENRNLEIASISQELKALAKEVGCPVYALSQLNRGLEQRVNKRPVNSDLRESGSIEQDADLILFIYRDEVYNEESMQRGIAEIIIGKQRNGPLKNVLTRFRGEYSLFENLNEQRN